MPAELIADGSSPADSHPRIKIGRSYTSERWPWRCPNNHDNAPIGVEPAQDGIPLGRFLVGVLGAPHGTKIHADLRVPSWLASCPRETRRRWARTYVSVRGVELSRGPGRQIREADRPDGYHDALLALFRDVVDDTDGLSQGKHAIYLREPVCDALDVVPKLPGVSASFNNSSESPDNPCMYIMISYRVLYAKNQISNTG